MPDDTTSSAPAMPADATQRPATTSESKTAETEDVETQNWWDYCPNCSSRLYNQGCKYRCPKCHYFMSCSDFD